MKGKIVDYSAVNNLIFLGTFKNPKVLKGLTEAILDTNIKIEDIKLMDPNIYQGIELKSSEFDIRYTLLEKETDIILEMQNKKTKYSMEDRLVYYASQHISQSISKGGSFIYKDCCIIALLNFTLYKDNQCIREFKLKDEFNNEIKKLKLIIIELTKSKYCHKMKLKKWLELIKTNEPYNLKGDDDCMDEAINYIYELNEDELIRERMRIIKNSERHIQTEKDAYRIEGLKEGKKEGILLVAKKMKAMNMSINDIKEATGLSIEEINNI